MILKPASPILRCAIRTVFQERFTYNDQYFGKFDYHDREKYPRKMAQAKEEALLDDIREMKEKEQPPSPFHIVTRIKSSWNSDWHIKVLLRRLNLHSSRAGDCVIVPNTPQFNDMLRQVKHLITLRPATFEGRIPTKEDIGAIKVCPQTGVIKIDEKVRMLESRVNLEKPPLFRGNELRHKINLKYGICHNINSI